MKVDMSARGVTARLKRTSQLRRLCLLLGKAKVVDFDRLNLVRHVENAESKSIVCTGNCSESPPLTHAISQPR